MESRLSRVSEVSEYSEDFSITSSQRAPNFSRPQPRSNNSYDSQDPLIPNGRRYSTARAINAFYEPSRELPDEPRFSDESDRTQLTNSDNSAGSEFAWDGEKGELVARPRKKQYDEQRYTGQPRMRVRPTTGKTSSSSNSDNSMSAFASPERNNSWTIHKRVSVDQQSDYASTIRTNDQYEDTRSHHTVSDEEDENELMSVDSNGTWQSSNYETTGLSDAKIKKLLKKGINPSLYAEMQAARNKGKSKWVGPLIGNSFIS